MHRPRTLLRFLVATLVVAAGTAVVGRAAGLTVTVGSLGANRAQVQACVPAGNSLAVTLVTARNNVTGVTITGFPAACGGAPLSASLTNANNVNGQGSCTVVSGTCRVSTLSSPVAAKNPDYPMALEIVAVGGSASSGAGSLRVSAQDLTPRSCSLTSTTGSC